MVSWDSEFQDIADPSRLLVVKFSCAEASLVNATQKIGGIVYRGRWLGGQFQGEGTLDVLNCKTRFRTDKLWNRNYSTGIPFDTSPRYVFTFSGFFQSGNIEGVWGSLGTRSGTLWLPQGNLGGTSWTGLFHAMRPEGVGSLRQEITTRLRSQSHTSSFSQSHVIHTGSVKVVDLEGPPVSAGLAGSSQVWNLEKLRFTRSGTGMTQMCASMASDLRKNFNFKDSNTGRVFSCIVCKRGSFGIANDADNLQTSRAMQNSSTKSRASSLETSSTSLLELDSSATVFKREDEAPWLAECLAAEQKLNASSDRRSSFSESSADSARESIFSGTEDASHNVQLLQAIQNWPVSTCSADSRSPTKSARTAETESRTRGNPLSRAMEGPIEGPLDDVADFNRTTFGSAGSPGSHRPSDLGNNRPEVSPSLPGNNNLESAPAANAEDRATGSSELETETGDRFWRQPASLETTGVYVSVSTLLISSICSAIGGVLLSLLGMWRFRSRDGERSGHTTRRRGYTRVCESLLVTKKIPLSQAYTDTSSLESGYDTTSHTDATSLESDYDTTSHTDTSSLDTDYDATSYTDATSLDTDYDTTSYTDATSLESGYDTTSHTDKIKSLESDTIEFSGLSSTSKLFSRCARHRSAAARPFAAPRARPSQTKAATARSTVSDKGESSVFEYPEFGVLERNPVHCRRQCVGLGDSRRTTQNP